MNAEEAARENGKLMAGLTPGPAELHRWTQPTHDETLHHEFKSGLLELNKKDNPAKILRKYVAGFANSAGGFVVFGYSQVSGSYDGFSAPGGGSLVDWATRALAPLRPFLSPPPRIFEAVSGDKRVLVVATDRSPSLVPCLENGEEQYYLRIGDSTEAPPNSRRLSASCH